MLLKKEEVLNNSLNRGDTFLKGVASLDKIRADFDFAGKAVRRELNLRMS